mmetsp:Transcript_24463/g.55708  ORF Transcript_24463/g.55708 Transcript_24463/m.55708 type:complete len:129 (+) Transcript_24463:307-693(+)
MGYSISTATEKTQEKLVDTARAAQSSSEDAAGTTTSTEDAEGRAVSSATIAVLPGQPAVESRRRSGRARTFDMDGELEKCESLFKDGERDASNAKKGKSLSDDQKEKLKRKLKEGDPNYIKDQVQKGL